jgi:hypothetical protein
MDLQWVLNQRMIIFITWRKGKYIETQGKAMVKTEAEMAEIHLQGKKCEKLLAASQS